MHFIVVYIHLQKSILLSQFSVSFAENCNISHMKCILSLTCTHTHCTVSFPLLLFYSRGCFWLPHSHTFIRHSSHTVCHMISALGLTMMLMMSDATLFNKYSYSVVKYVNKQNKSYFFSILSLTVV